MKKITLNLTPGEVAAQLSSQPDLVFIDSAGNLPQSYHAPTSIIASGATTLLKGEISDVKTLNSQLELALNQPSTPLPLGWIDYEGNYTIGIFPSYLLFDHQHQQWYSQGNLPSLFQNHERSPIKIGSFKSNFTQQEYEARVRRIKEYIAAGDIYQANLTQRFAASIEAESLFPVYLALRVSNPAPMASYLKLAGKEILSSSPETFLRMEQRTIETRPIKGTSPRFSEPDQDQASAHELTSSEKENAELTMITDLLRNDIGQVCEFGSVSVPELNQLEPLQHVFHLVSKVTGTLRSNCSHAEALAACYPGGSITGAPKIRAMQIIEELETVPRGIYTGAIGYLQFHGKSQFNIAIRTLIREQHSLYYHVGAGIVADSDPTHEYKETLQKAKGIRKALAHFLP